MKRTIKKVCALAIFGGMLITLAPSCVDEPQTGLLIKGVPMREMGDCSQFDDNEEGSYVFGGSYDIGVYAYGGPSYYIDLEVENYLDKGINSIRGRGEGNWVTMRSVEFSFDVPEGWPADSPLPKVVYDLGYRLEPGASKRFMDLEMINQAFVDAVDTIYDLYEDLEGTTVDSGSFATIIVRIKVKGQNSSGDTITSNTFYYRLNICSQCTISTGAKTCCASKLNQNYTGAKAAYDALVTAEETKGNCHMTQDEVSPVYCSWLPLCINGNPLRHRYNLDLDGCGNAACP